MKLTQQAMAALWLTMATLFGSAHAVTYNVTNIGSLGGSRLEAHAINASGEVAGFAQTSDKAPFWFHADF